MIKKQSRSEVRVKKHMKVRNRFSGTAERPRLAVFRSNNHMYAQIIDDTVGNTLVSASTLQKDVKAELEKTNNVEAAAYLGKVIAEKALEKKTGARALRAIIEEFMLDIMYETPKDKNIGRVIITSDYINKKGGPVIEPRGANFLPLNE